MDRSRDGMERTRDWRQRGLGAGDGEDYGLEIERTRDWRKRGPGTGDRED
jgi:hypothetical protein